MYKYINDLFYLGSTICSFSSKHPTALYLEPVPQGSLLFVRQVDHSERGRGKYWAHGQGVVSTRDISLHTV